MRQRIGRGRHAFGVMAGLALAVIGSGSASAIIIDTCPYTITKPGYYVLVKDLKCDESGIIIQSSNVKLDLGGHTLCGPWAGTGDCPEDADGIIVESGLKHVTIQNGKVTRFETGVSFELDTEMICVARMKIIENCENGIDADDPGNSVHVYVHNQISKNGGNGIELAGNDHHICFNQVSKNGENGILYTGNRGRFVCNTSWANGVPEVFSGGGFCITGDDNLFRSNVAYWNTDDGFDIMGDRNVLTSNKASQNGEDGIDLELGSRNNVLTGNSALQNGSDPTMDHDLEDDLIPSCENTWKGNFFGTDNEAGANAGPGAGCIQ